MQYMLKTQCRICSGHLVSVVRPRLVTTNFPKDRLKSKISCIDWLHNHHIRRVSENLRQLERTFDASSPPSAS